MPPFQIRRCRAHSQTACWLVRKWQETTKSYVHMTSRTSFEGAVKALPPR